MDETGIYISVGILAIVFAVVVAMVWYWRRATRNAAIARSWPVAEATIESAALEPIADSSTRTPIILPVFAFSYQFAGNYYSGRFSLSHINTDTDDLIQRMIGRKLQVRFNPSFPDVWFIADEQIDGCRVEQKIGPHVLGLYPRE